jgi:hypothetical protein
MSQDKRNDLVATDSQSQDEPLKSAPQPNQSNYSEDMIKKLVDDWYKSRKESETKAQFEQELRDYLESERSTLIDELIAKLPDGDIKGWQVKTILEEYRNDQNS